MKLSFFGLLIFGFVFVACTPSKSSDPDPKPAKPPQNDQPATNGGSKPIDPPTTGPASNPTTKQVDVILVNAIGDENPSQSSQQKKFIKQLVSALGKKSQSQDLKVALIASPTAATSGVAVTLDASDGFKANTSMQLSFEVAAKDGFLGAIVAGCPVKASNLDSTHSAGSVTVCDTSISIPQHAWAWGVDDLKGRLEGFLRPGVQRIYVYFISNDPQIVSASQFLTISSKQNAGKAPMVIAIAPSTINAPCDQKNLRATKIEELVKGSSGKVYSYCQADWTTYLEAILQSI